MEYQLKDKFLHRFKKIPFYVPFFVVITCLYGFVILYSAAEGQVNQLIYKQIIIFIIFAPIALLISVIDLRYIYNSSYIFYFVVLILLFLVAITGKTAMGATRWINLGFFHIQPSEPAKIAMVLMISRYFHDLNLHGGELNIKHLIIPIILVAMPASLIIKQPDLGTGMIVIFISAVMLFAVGVKTRYFAVVGIGVLSLLPVMWHFMRDYQKKRILTFLDPEREPLGDSYNIIQSKIAIGSGGLFGKGLLRGTQSHLDFLPEYETDFIFAFLAEELGFIGGIFLLSLYLMIIVSSLVVSINTKSKFAKLMSIGLTTIFFTHVFINMAMVMGMMPVVGVPLPFISYGGTMMVSMLLGFGLIMNAGVNHRTNF